MKTVFMKKSCPVHFTGAPSPAVEKGPAVKFVGALPHRIELIKPRLLVKKGDRVKTGSLLFADKTDEKLVFLSPGAGVIHDIQYGHRRAVTQIVIELNTQEESVSFEPVNITQTDCGEFIDILKKRGLWPLVRSLPYRNIASADEKPGAIWVALDTADFFQVPSYIYLKGKEDRFAFGVKALERLGVPVFVIESARAPANDKTVASLVTHRASGSYPAEDPGVVHYFTKQSAKQNRAWYINGQDLLLIAESLETRRYPTGRIVAVSDAAGDNGRYSQNSRYVETRMGAPLASLLGDAGDAADCRWITGGLFCGHTGSADTYLGFYETSLTLIREAKYPELFGFLRPGLYKPTCSRTFLSALHKNPLAPVADMRGEERACINCGKCEKACPVDIMVQFTYKCIYADEIEEALSHGMLDCVECGLCSYVCPAKIELAETLKTTKHAYFLDRI